MPYPIDKKLVIAVSSSALFNMEESDSVYKAQGINKYREYQEKNIDRTLEKGVAYPFIRRLLSLNKSFPEEMPVEIVLFSRNSPETGLRAFRSIKKYGLNISRAYFSSGKSNFEFLPAFNATLFLSSNNEDTRMAIEAGYAAGTVLNKEIIDDDNDLELRLAFDFDGVIADDSSEQYYQQHEGDMEEYFAHEQEFASSPLSEGPVGKLLQKIAFFQRMERKKKESQKDYVKILRTSIVTARNAPAHERVITTLKKMGVEVDDAFFLGGIDKSRILNVLRPHIFFDDQMLHLSELGNIPAVHIPFGIANKLSQGKADPVQHPVISQ